MRRPSSGGGNPLSSQSHNRSAGSPSAALHVVIPGDLETRTGGYGYDRRIIAGLRQRGWSVSVLRLDDSFPFPSPAARAQAAEVLARIPSGSMVLVDGLALGALPVEVEREAVRLKIVAMVHHPLAAETGLDPALAAALETSESRALAFVRSVVVTSRATAVRLADYGVSADRITVVEPGTDPAPLAKGSERVGLSSGPRASGVPSSMSPYSARGEPVEPRATLAGSSFDKLRTSGLQDRQTREPHPRSPVPSPEARDVALLCVATLTPRKGYDLLLSALAAIPQRNWRLTCAGSLDRDPATVARVRAQLRDNGLEDRVSLAGDMDGTALGVQYDRADLFVLATLYEGYGMAVAEALARGLPVISTATGAIEDLVLGNSSVPLARPEPDRRQPDTAAGIVVPPGDLAALTDALSRVVGDADLRSRLAANAREVRDHLPTWDAAAAAMARALEAVAEAAE
jgi:glycosyltransferase involved in cell wall biosynthesis